MLFGVPIMSIISDEKTDHTNMANRSDMFSLFGRMMDDAFLQIDHQSVIINANHGAVRLLGEHLMGVSLTQRLIYSELMEDLERCVTSNEITEFAATPSNNEFLRLAHSHAFCEKLSTSRSRSACLEPRSS